MAAAVDAPAFVRTDEGKAAVEFAKSRLDPWFVDRAMFVPLIDWNLSATTEEVRARYLERFGEKVETRIPIYNWKRMDFALHRIERAASVLDIGPGYGEFVNGMALANSFKSINCIDIRDYNLYTDIKGVIDRRKLDLFELPDNQTYEVVTCFEVLEHLPQELVAEAVEKIRNISTRMFAVSMPLKETPLSKFHLTMFDESLLASLFPDGDIYVLSKDKHKNMRWVYVEVRKGQR